MNAGTPSVSSLVDLSGRRALVTGAGKGIGAATARRLAEAGAFVTVADLDQVAGRATADALVAEGLSASFVVCDVTDAAQLVDAVTSAADGERLDVLVNNAGIFPTTGPIDAVTDEFVARMLDVNVRAQFSAAREAARFMTDGGSIVNIGSVAGLRGGANITAYATSKAAIVGLTRSFATELGPRGIRVNAIAPGVIDTPGVQDQMAPLKAGGMDIDKVIAGNPLRTAGRPDHIARAALFLASDLAAFVTGHVLVVDGGYTA
jgi:NAD(P)-dependent dehydrogenase (short-subunit alcohol dehydrogenase family)